MALLWADRVLETTTTTGTGAFALSAAVTGFKRFSAISGIATNDTAYYFAEAVDASGIPTGDWEVGLGTYSAANELTRTTILASSNAGAAVSFAAGTKRVGLTMPANIATLAPNYVVPMGFTTAPTASEILLIHVFVNSVTFPANWAGVQKYVGTNPAATFALDVTKVGTGSVGALSISTAGALTATTAAGAAISFAAGDVMTITAPASADASVANVGITLKGTGA